MCIATACPPTGEAPSFNDIQYLLDCRPEVAFWQVLVSQLTLRNQIKNLIITSGSVIDVKSLPQSLNTCLSVHRRVHIGVPATKWGVGQVAQGLYYYYFIS